MIHRRDPLDVAIVGGLLVHGFPKRFDPGHVVRVRIRGRNGRRRACRGGRIFPSCSSETDARLGQGMRALQLDRQAPAIAYRRAGNNHLRLSRRRLPEQEVRDAGKVGSGEVEERGEDVGEEVRV